MSKIQKQDVKTLAQLTGAGAAASDLINDTQIYVSANSFNKQLSAAITDGDIGGGGGGSINLIDNSDAESNTTGWVTYADAAGSRPVDGTGGSPNITWTRSTSSPLNGVGSFLFTKDAVNRQGQGVSYDFAVAPIYRAKVLQIEIPMLVSSGTFVAGSSSTDSDVIAYIYDVTNSKLIEPSTFKFFNGSGVVADKLVANFQTSSDGATYRLILHCATTSASAYVLKFDDIVVSPTTLSFGTPITDWQSYTPSNTQGFGTIAAVELFWRRVGSSAQIRGRFTSGTVTGSEAQLSLPVGLTSAGTAIIPNVQSAHGAFFYNVASGAYSLVLIQPSVTYLNFGLQGAGNAGLALAAGSTVSSTGIINTLFADVPIAGWSAQVQSSDVNDQRIVSASVKTPTSSLTGSFSDVVFGTIDKDTHAAYNSTTGVFTVPVSGIYNFIANLTSSATVALNDTLDLQLMKNGVVIRSSREYAGGVVTEVATDITAGGIECVAGDLIKFQAKSSATSPTYIGTTFCFASFQKVANPASITSTELIAAKYFSNGSSSFANTNPVNFDIKDFDTHNAVTVSATAWRFTAPAAGLYLFNAAVYVNSGGVFQNQLWKNGANNTFLGYTTPGGVMFAGGNTTIRLNAGDYIDLRNDLSFGSVGTTALNNQFCSITRIGI